MKVDSKNDIIGKGLMRLKRTIIKTGDELQ